MDTMKLPRWRFSPTQLIVGAFALLILLGTGLLLLPIAHAPGVTVSPLEAFFTATSCVCVTGLVVVESGAAYSLFGQVVLLCLIQIGGLGVMTLATLVLVLLGRRVTLRGRVLLQEALGFSGLTGLVRLLLQIVRLVAVIELSGAILLATRFVPRFGWGRGLFYALFHAVSAFCNAGFDVLGLGNSLVSLNGDPVVMGTLMLLIVLGGLGFAVILDVLRQRRFRRLSLHSRVVLLFTVLLLAEGFALFLLTEGGNPATLGAMSWPKRLLNAAFESVTLRTAGFASFDQGAMTVPSKLLASVFMFIGASPFSTGGGLKTTTLACLCFTEVAAIRGKASVNLYGRRLEQGVVLKAQAIFSIALATLIALTLGLTVLEPVGSAPLFSLENIVFEAASALGTAGLTAGLTASLTAAGKLLLILAMFAGRVGPLSLTLALSQRLTQAEKAPIDYPEDTLLVG